MSYNKLKEYAYICCNAYKFELSTPGDLLIAKAYYIIGCTFYEVLCYLLLKSLK